MKILTWNMSYAYGRGSEGTDAYTPKDLLHFQSTLEAMVHFIRGVNPDIVLLQEVDFNSKRSHFQNQLELLARSTELMYHSKIVSWNVPYLPYPGLNPLRQFGRILSGGGVLSKKPIRVVQQDFLPKPREFNRLYRALYLNRYFQIVETGDLKLCNLHIEAFSEENRDLHIHKLHGRLIDYDIDIVGGDFNGPFDVKPEFTQKWTAHPAPTPTFPAPNPDQVLDGFIVKKSMFPSVEIETLDSGTISDHFPVLLRV